MKNVKNGGISFQFFILLGRNTNDAIMQNFIQISQKLKIGVQNVFKLVKDTPPPFPVLGTVIVATIGPPLIELNVRSTDILVWSRKVCYDVCININLCSFISVIFKQHITKNSLWINWSSLWEMSVKITKNAFNMERHTWWIFATL